MGWVRDFFGSKEDTARSGDSGKIAELRARCEDLRKRILWSREKLSERGSAHEALQTQYLDERARLQQSLDDLHSERVRNFALFSNRDLVISKAKRLQTRVGELKERLAKYEVVADGPFDRVPIVVENSPPSGNEPPGGGFRLH